MIRFTKFLFRLAILGVVALFALGFLRGKLFAELKDYPGAALREAAFNDGDSFLDRVHPSWPLDLNNASMEELQTISGIGPALAERIIEGRPFKSVEELRRVSGVGPVLLADVEDKLVVKD